MEKKSFFVFTILAVALVVVGLLAIGLGPMWIPPAKVVCVLLSKLGFAIETDLAQETVVWVIRLPRMLFGMIVGASLAQSGAALQGLFRNPLADPGLIGVSSGAALGAVIIIVLQDHPAFAWTAILGRYAVPVSAFIVGLGVTFSVYRIAYSRKNTDIATLLLTGIAVSFLTMALMGILIYRAADDELRNLTFWQMGSLARVSWEQVLVILPTFIVANAFLIRLAKPLDLFLLGEDEAGFLGLSVEHIKRAVMVLSSFLVAGAVAFSGVIGFVGLVVPHMLRLSLGPNHRGILWGSALLGAVLLLMADIVARMIVMPAELPIGIVTTLLGVPFFLYLLIHQKRRLHASL